MTYRVVVTENAKRNLRRYYEHAAENAPKTAPLWLDRFQAALQTLATQPERCPIAPESEAVDSEIRQLVFGRRSGAFRVLFSIAEDEVRVLHIRRGVMQFAEPDELYG